MHELLLSTCCTKIRQVLAALNVLELGSTHSSVLTNLLGIPGDGFSCQVKHSTKYYASQSRTKSDAGCRGEQNCWMAEAKHLRKSAHGVASPWLLPPHPLQPAQRIVSAAGRAPITPKFCLEINFIPLIRTGNTSCFLLGGEH